jgi:hypothetical protein
MDIYERHVPPESLRIPHGVLTSKNARINFGKAHAPLLMIAGSTDHIIPASPSITRFQEYAGRNHFGFGHAGWEAMADDTLRWLESPRP